MEQSLTAANSSQWMKKVGEIPIVLAVVAIVILMVIPVPTLFLDLFLVSSISVSLLILMLALYSTRALDFSIFPTMLLFATLFRLSLNIASTRLILGQGSNGEGAAGDVIEAFGYFITGGNYVVGFIIFLILVLINFIVITKGAGRIAEVAARFALDGMPGKQLAVDADLNAGSIDDATAKARREDLEKESDFYGAMDGASKFVKGDAIAGIVITIINVIGGFVIGILQEGLTMAESGKIYTVLSVGDGLVSQIPALIISVAAGVIVTKVSKKKMIATEIKEQTLAKTKPLAISAFIVLVIGLSPGLPLFPFFVLASILGGTAYYTQKNNMRQAEEKEKSTHQPEEQTQEDRQDIVPMIEAIEIEVGYDLIPIVDQKSGGDFSSKIVGIRKQFANEMGIIIPAVHIRDNLKLRPSEYKIYIKGSLIGSSELMPHHCLALDPGNSSNQIEGVVTEDPTFGLPALWIPEDQREQAIVSGYTVVDLSSVMATHLTELIKKHLSELFNRQDLDQLVSQLQKSHPKLIEELIPDLLDFGGIQKVLKKLLDERISIRDLLTILESLADHAAESKEIEYLTEMVRVSLGRQISHQFINELGQLNVITLDRAIEDQLQKALVKINNENQIILDPDQAKYLIESIAETLQAFATERFSPILLTSQHLRPHLYNLIKRFIPNLNVLSHSEVADHSEVKVLAVVGATQ